MNAGYVQTDCKMDIGMPDAQWCGISRMLNLHKQIVKLNSTLIFSCKNKVLLPAEGAKDIKNLVLNCNLALSAAVLCGPAVVHACGISVDDM